MKLRDANLQVYEKKIHISSFMCFAFILYERITITSSERGFGFCASKISFRKYKQKVLFAIYLFNCSSSKSTPFMLNVAFDFVLVQFLSKKLEFIAMRSLQKHSSFLIVCLLISSTI